MFLPSGRVSEDEFSGRATASVDVVRCSPGNAPQIGIPVHRPCIRHNALMAAQRVLIVEDDEEISGALARTLGREGYETACTGTVAGALDAVATEHWDAVLLDLGLPDGDGLEVARELRAKNAIPVLVVTARDEVTSRVAGLDAGADDYLVKPFDRAELLEHVWHHDPTEPTNTVEVFVSNLRRKLESGGEERLLRTVRGSGYALGAA
jgi:DNA-binding response OmpR family regulator